MVRLIMRIPMLGMRSFDWGAESIAKKATAANAESRPMGKEK